VLNAAGILSGHIGWRIIFAAQEFFINYI
jgi:hypothetical protein